MKVVTEAKTKDEAIQKALEELKVNLEDIMYTQEKIKGKLFKADTIKITAYTKDEVINFMKDFIEDLVNNMRNYL